MSRFMALPVGQGDAFYLERKKLSVLIDGGRSRNGFPSMFREITGRDGVDVVVCTHNDADHTNGIQGFIEAGLICDEVWLPGRWLGVLPDVLRPFVEVFEDIASSILKGDGLVELPEVEFGTPAIETYAARVEDVNYEDAPAEEGPPLAGDGWPEECLDMLEQAESWEPNSYWPWQRYPDDLPLWPYWHHRQLAPTDIQLLWSAIDAAARIRAIATEAFHRGIPVRWFDFDPATPNGGCPALQAINAHEVATVQPNVASLLTRLALTTANKESLVFWSPPAGNVPGVLFTADSDLRNAKLPPNLDHHIVTSPHHGSEANVNAYGTIAAVKGSSSVTWVRSDGRFRRRPGNPYLAIQSRRLCTLCRQANGFSSKKQTVHFFARRKRWVKHPSSQLCSCI